MQVLRTQHDDLADLAEGGSPLVDASVGPTGFRLLRRLGRGGMATVFLAERAGPLGSMLSARTPDRIAIKILQAGTHRDLEKLGADPHGCFRKDVVALGRVSALTPPPVEIVQLFGHGELDVAVRTRTYRLPWMAIELVDGGPDGGTLDERVHRAPEGIDPPRALRMTNWLLRGVRKLHELGAIHRDLKPENVLVAGAVASEALKITDCGIARVEGLASSVAAFTRGYAPPEQMLPAVGGRRNPLIGAWTDVHALAALIWFIIGGEPWCRDASWYERGERRSLRTATRLHRGFLVDLPALAELDRVLARGASPALPAQARREVTGLGLPVKSVQLLTEGEERLASVEVLEAHLAPILERIDRSWREVAAHERRPPTHFGGTVALAGDAPSGDTTVEEISLRCESVDSRPTLEPGRVAFQLDGRFVALSTDRVLYVTDGGSTEVPTSGAEAPDELRSGVSDTFRVLFAGTAGFVLVSPRALWSLRDGTWRRDELPAPLDRTGPLQAASVSRDILWLASEGDEDDGALLWRREATGAWSSPVPLSFSGRVHDISEGPMGTLVTGASPKGRARAAVVGPDGTVSLITTGLASVGALRLALCGLDGSMWAASEGALIRCDRRGAMVELETQSPPVRIALDRSGMPWLATQRSVFRRETRGSSWMWRRLLDRPDDRAAFVALGFGTDGAIVVDARGDATRVATRDLR